MAVVKLEETLFYPEPLIITPDSVFVNVGERNVTGFGNFFD
jgi:cobalamin-dependent methionine synthase I